MVPRDMAFGPKWPCRCRPGRSGRGACRVMEFLFEKVVRAYRAGESVTLDVGERDGYVVIGLTMVGENGDTRACLLEPADAGAVVPSDCGSDRAR